MRRGAFLGAALLSAAALSGCAGNDGWPFVPAEAVSTATDSPATESVTAAAGQRGTSGSGRAPAHRSAAEPAAAQPSATPGFPMTEAPRQVVGLDRASVRRLLGEPSFIRREPPAEVWQYRGPACVLDLFLYEEAAGPRVVHVEARTGAAEPLPTDTCIVSLLTKRSARAG